MTIHRHRDHSSQLPALSAIAGAVLLLAACGGGGSDTPANPPAGNPSVLTGTAAIGAALAAASVDIRDKDGAVCAEQTIVTTETGAYECTLLAGKAAPFTIVVTDPSGGVAPMVSIATETPQPGTPLVVNVTPLTTAIVAQLSPTRDALAVAGAPATVDAAQLQVVTANVLAQLADVLAALNVPAGYDPFSTPFVAATASVQGDTADRVVDVLRFSTVNGEMRIATVDKPELAVALAGASGSAPPLAAPSAGVATLSNSLKLLSTALTNCFAVELAQRVLATDDTISANDGGPEVTSTAAQCDDIIHPDFYNGGRRAGQQFHGLLTDPDMTGAKFNLPEVLVFLPASGSQTADRAVIRVMYTDNKGQVNSLMTVARQYPGTEAGRGTDWWIYGNQHPIEASVRPMLRRNLQLAAAGTGPFVNAGNSRFESGMNIFINKDGPNSNGMRAVRVTGPGLPSSGAVFTRPEPGVASTQNWLNLRRKDGNTDPAAATTAPGTDNNYYLQRSAGASGEAARTVRANPNAANTNNMQYVNWAHPIDHNHAAGSTSYIDFGTLGANGVYTFEVFYEGELAPRYTFNSLRLHPVVPATQAVHEQWVDLTPAALRYLDPADALAASTASMSVSWIANPLAQPIRGVGVFTAANGAPVNQPTIGLPLGATSVTVDAPQNGGVTVSFPALTADGTSSRMILLRYLTFDASYKDSLTRYN